MSGRALPPLVANKIISRALNWRIEPFDWPV